MYFTDTERLKHSPGPSQSSRDSSVLLWKLFYAAFHGVYGWSNRFLAASDVNVDVGERVQRYTVPVHESFLSSWEKRRVIHDSSLGCVGAPLSHWADILAAVLVPFFSPTSASTSPSAAVLFSLRMNWNKYHL